MTTMPASEFKAKCLRIMERVRQRREEVLITKRGVPVAKLVPVKSAKSKKNVFGCMKGTVEIVGDIVSPSLSESEWSAADKEWDEMYK
jgi:prevent-host-death family protein